MDAAVLVARLVLAAVFAAAALTKLRDRDTAARSVSDLGAPAAWARPLSLALPLAELAVAVGLLVDVLAAAAAAAALGLLCVFTAAIGNALRQNRRPDCGCFGDLSQKPISGRTLARNGGLAALALLVAVAGPGASLAAPLELAIVIVVVAAMVGLGGLLGRRGRESVAIPLRPVGTPASLPPDRSGIPVGDVAPEFELPAAAGEGVVALSSLRDAGLPAVLLFLSAGCGSCMELHPHLHRWQVTLAERVTIAVIMAGDTDGKAARELSGEHGVENVLIDDSPQPQWAAYRMPGTPSGVAVDPDGRVASPSVRGAEALEELVRQTVRHSAQTSQAWKQPTRVA